MIDNGPVVENSLVDQALAWLRTRLPETWKIEPTARVELKTPDGRADAAIDLTGPNGVYITLILEVKRQIDPRDVDRLVTGVARTMQTLSNFPILVVAPWLSSRTQKLLQERSLNYLDLTGNSLIRLDNPTLFIKTEGATKDPLPLPKNKVRVQGPKAGRLIRFLSDFRPPYGVRELADASGLAASYVSRVLEVLDDEAIIERTSRGGVESVNVTLLIKRWASNYDVFRSNTRTPFLAPKGQQDAYESLATTRLRVAITGSFAAYRFAPVTGPAMLVAYSDSPMNLANELGWLPTDQGANVALLSPFDPIVWTNTFEEGSLTYVALAQAAVDCLTGNGRMPAEGEALLQWMSQNENSWRLPKLKKLNLA
jgi:hypothetical protein